MPGCAAPYWLRRHGAEPAQAQLRTEEPRAFGQRVGDVVQRRVLLQLPPGRQLDPSSLPQAGRRGRAIELKAVRWTPPAWWQAQDAPHEILLDYQVFVSPPEVRTLELPPFRLSLRGGERPEELRVDAWPLTLAPLVPREPSPRNGLGDLRPEAPAPLIDTGPRQARLWALAVLASPGLIYLIQVYLLAPWWASRRRPFARAHQAMRRLGCGHTPAQQQQALRLLHGALDQTAGEVLFEQGLDRFLRQHPRYAPLRAELQRFFAQSRTSFFGGGVEASGDWLPTLARQCADLERGAA